jgi:tetraacyldisaccharide 4'-kinase
MLREPVTGLARADVVCLSRADLVTPAERNAIRQRVAQFAPQAAWCEVVHAPHGLINSTGQTQPLDFLKARRVAAFCGLGNPTGFRRTLDSTGCQIAAWREFPDHHAFSSTNLDELARAAEDAAADIVICTHKDLVKVEREQLGNRPLWAVTVELQFIAGQQEMHGVLERTVK